MEVDEDDFGGVISESEEDNVSEFTSDSESEEDQDDLENEAENSLQSKRLREIEELEEEIDNCPLSKRIQLGKRRGRPISKLKGKNGYVWSKNKPSRSSDRLNVPLPEFTYGPVGDAANC
ncbi:hypothetical protein ABEB36_010768 [Hypothenemus hampei]|uniref:Uncharacterized protein n=1 Tax=Hypothenemus hampei TaxID=57062 RepID=A0ABD1EF28_HYPHA